MLLVRLAPLLLVIPPLVAADATQTTSEVEGLRATNDLRSDHKHSSWNDHVGRNILRNFEDHIHSGWTAVKSGLRTFLVHEYHKFLKLDKAAIDALPVHVLNIPPYANWTDNAWNVRFHGNVYKQPNISQKRLDRLANKFLFGTSIQKLPPEQAAQARNITAEIFVVHQSHQNVSFYLEPAPSAGSSGEPGGGGAVTPGGGSQNISISYPTTVEGDFDAFIKLANVSGSGLAGGNETIQIQRLNVYAHGTDTGNATAYLVPPRGITVVSDIDDILKVTKIYRPKEGLLNTFARPYKPWMNMPDIYANWSRSIQNVHFHYLTTTPEQITRNYMGFIYNNYPGGSFDTRPLNFSDISATRHIRRWLLRRILQTFPERDFILIADTSNGDVMKDYPEMAKDFPDQVQCILLRNTSATDPGDRIPYNTAHFRGVPKEKYMFFRVPDDLAHLDIANGHCYNSSIQQNVTFGWQGLPFGLGKKFRPPLSRDSEDTSD